MVKPVLSAFSVRQSVGAQSIAAPTTEIGTLENEFMAGNPTASKATVNLQIRPVDVPINWSYGLDNLDPELEPGETITVTLTLDLGRSVLEETEMRIGADAFIGDELVGGILFNPTIPSSTPGSSLFLPTINR